MFQSGCIDGKKKHCIYICIDSIAFSALLHCVTKIWSHQELLIDAMFENNRFMRVSFSERE